MSNISMINDEKVLDVIRDIIQVCDVNKDGLIEMQELKNYLQLLADTYDDKNLLEHYEKVLILVLLYRIIHFV